MRMPGVQLVIRHSPLPHFRCSPSTVDAHADDGTPQSVCLLDYDRHLFWRVGLLGD